MVTELAMFLVLAGGLVLGVTGWLVLCCRREAATRRRRRLQKDT